MKLEHNLIRDSVLYSTKNWNENTNLSGFINNYDAQYKKVFIFNINFTKNVDIEFHLFDFAFYILVVHFTVSRILLSKICQPLWLF